MSLIGSHTASAAKHAVGEHNVFLLGMDVHRRVFPISAVTVIVFVIFGLSYPGEADRLFNGARSWITVNLDWLFILGANFFLLFSFYLILSPLGRIRIGGIEAQPDYSYMSWFAMMFAAGVGIGLMFYGVLEPVNHTLRPPLNISSNDPSAAAAGLSGSIYHWGLHAWGIYCIVGLSLAIFHFNKGLPLTVRSAFYPLLGERIWGWPGHVIDILAVFATLFGLATSLGLGAQQIAAGLQYLFGIENTDGTKVVVVIVITAVALFSVIRGMDKGVKLLSEINVAMALGLLLFVIAAGPTLALLGGAIEGLLDYLVYLPKLSNPAARTDTYFYHDWTIFYWAWWIAWSPFVGVFIARVSRGRTVREFLLCTLLVPTAVCVMWLTAFGGSAVSQFMQFGESAVVTVVQQGNTELPLFYFLETLPLNDISSLLALFLIVIFFVTSMDSGSLVIDSIAAGGKLNTPVGQRVFWCTFEGLVAIALMLGGGLTALQGASLVSGLPFLLVLLLMIVSLHKGLREELR
ncbi:MAG: BCCT family transporter [Halioglobus sp.]